MSICVIAGALFIVPNRFGIHPSQNALCGRLIPEWGQQVAVLGFDPARGLSRAHQSQNDLEQGAARGIVLRPAVNPYGIPGANPYRLNFHSQLYGKQAFFRTDFTGGCCCAGFARDYVGVPILIAKSKQKPQAQGLRKSSQIRGLLETVIGSSLCY